MKRIILFVVILVSGAVLTAADLVEVTPVHEQLVLLHFDDGTIDYHEAGEPTHADRAIVEPLAIATLSAAGFSVTSSGDANYQTAVNPSGLGRKSKGTEFAVSSENWVGGFGFQPTTPYAAREHWIYLELPTAMVEGQSYEVTWDAAALNTSAANASLTFTASAARSESVHVNQIGYDPAATLKYGYVYHWAGDLGGIDFSRWQGQPFHLVDVGSGDIVFSGELVFRAAADAPESFQNDSPNRNFLGAPVWECDFSAFNTPGEYYLVVPGIGRSFPFEVVSDVYRQAFKATLHGLFQNRSGIELTSTYVNEPRPAPHNPQPVSAGGTPGFQDRLHYSTTRFYDIVSDGGGVADRTAMESGLQGNLTATWGWYQDAGDWDGYIAHTDIPVQLLLLYQLHPQKFADGELNIPESGNGLPDLVDEGAWLLRFFQRQRAELLSKGWGTGGVGARVFGDLWGSDRPDEIGRGSWQDTDRDWYVSGEDPFSTYRYAAGAAQMAEILAGLGLFDPDGVDWRVEAIAAFAWAQANTTATDETANVHGLLSEHRALAATALYRLTGEAAYHDVLRADLAGVSATENNLNRSRLAAIVLYLDPGMERIRDLETEIRLRRALLASARYFSTDSANQRACRWGGHFQLPMLIGQPTTPLIEPAIFAHKILAQSDPAAATEILATSYTTADYFLGNNPLNMTWITGLGERSPTAVFCMDDFYTGPALRKGLTPYGPWRFGDDWVAERMAVSPWWAWDTTYPSLDPRGSGQPASGAVAPGTWPGHEAWFANRNVPQTAEFTVWQNNLPNALTYGFLSADLPQLPQIQSVSGDATVVIDSDLELTVLATGQGPLSYQWLRDGVALVGQTRSTLELFGMPLDQAGAYAVSVSNAEGSVMSSPSRVTVVSAEAYMGTRAVNISTRGFSGSDANLLVPGFVIQGTGSRSLLIRAVGPRLADFGVSGFLVDPTLELISGSGNEVVAASDDWWTQPDADQIAEMAAQVGAFPLDGRASDGTLDTKSSAVLVDLTAGSYTALCRGKDDETGVALVEIYDLGDPDTARLINLSNRGWVGQGDQVMVPGFVVGGAVSRSYLIRAAGPALAEFGVQGVLADPQIEVRSAQGEQISVNDDWDENAAAASRLNAAFAEVGAFGFTAEAKDAATLVTLPPGAYTVLCRGADAGTGVALVEIYELP